MLIVSKVVLDASALLALLNQEPGHEQVEKHLSNSIISTVNVSETIATLLMLGIEEQELLNLISNIVPEVIPFDEKQAYLAALLRKETKQYGLSLGDRACLALAKIKNLPVMTADKIWGKLIIDVKINVIR